MKPDKYVNQTQEAGEISIGFLNRILKCLANTLQ